MYRTAVSLALLASVLTLAALPPQAIIARIGGGGGVGRAGELECVIR